MNFSIQGSRPIWQQLTEQLARRIITGAYPLGSRFPAVPHRDGKCRGARGDAAASGRGVYGRLFYGNESAGLFPRRGRGHGTGGKGQK